MFSTSYRSSSPATADTGLLHSSGLPAAVTAQVAIFSFGSPARTPRAIASKIVRYFAPSYFNGSLPISTDETIGRAPDGPKLRERLPVGPRLGRRVFPFLRRHLVEHHARVHVEAG